MNCLFCVNQILANKYHYWKNEERINYQCSKCRTSFMVVRKTHELLEYEMRTVCQGNTYRAWFDLQRKTLIIDNISIGSFLIELDYLPTDITPKNLYSKILTWINFS